MDRWVGRVAIVTGASSGIGEAVAKDLARHGMKVAALARRIERLRDLEDKCKGLKGSLKGYKCDVTNEEEIANTVAAVTKDLGPISVLINNAAVLDLIPLTNRSQGSGKRLFDTNVIGPITFIQLVVESMQEHKINDGHIININSITGHGFFPMARGANYCASKNGITVITKALKDELAAIKMKTKVTSISPGLVKTEMSEEYFKSIALSKAEPLPYLTGSELSECVIFALSTNPNVNISELTVQPVGETVSALTSH